MEAPAEIREISVTKIPNTANGLACFSFPRPLRAEEVDLLGNALGSLYGLSARRKALLLPEWCHAETRTRLTAAGFVLRDKELGARIRE